MASCSQSIEEKEEYQTRIPFVRACRSSPLSIWSMNGVSYAEIGRCLLIPKYEPALSRKEVGEILVGETGRDAKPAWPDNEEKLRSVRKCRDGVIDGCSCRAGSVP